MSAPMEIVKVPGVKSIVKIVKLKSKKGQNVSKGTLLCLYKTDSDDKVLKLKSSTTGTVREVFVKEGEECLAGYDYKCIYSIHVLALLTFVATIDMFL